MGRHVRKLLPIILTAAILAPMIACRGPVTKPNVPVTPSVFRPLQKDLQKHYLTLFREAPELEFSHRQIQQMHKYLGKAQDYCVNQYKKKAGQRKSRINQLQSELHNKSSSITDSKRHNLHCQIQNERVLRNQDLMLAHHAIPTAYANKQAKLQLVENWPSDLKSVKQKIASGAYRNRKWGDVKDIGFRKIAPNQKKDIPLGKKEVKRMRETGMMPPEVKNQEVVDYVKKVAHKVAENSDLRVPLHVTVLNAKEINAFALPGGYLFVERGLLEAADNEAELAGVLGHEIAHDVARHGHKLQHKANIMGILYQAAQIGALVLTGGAAGIGTYYALRYGFMGLGLALNLKMLGVSRKFELQADQLGMQYAWNAGYDPRGFIRFFDKMATTEGYVNGASWFRSHPPFYKRMKDSMREFMYLPKKQHYVENTTSFKKMKKELAKVKANAKEEEKNAPSLKPTKMEKGCPAPNKIEYKPDQPIETLCHLPTGKNSNTVQSQDQ